MLVIKDLIILLKLQWLMLEDTCKLRYSLPGRHFYEKVPM